MYKNRRRTPRPQNIDTNVIQPNWSTKVSTFDQMNLSENLLRGIYAYGFSNPSEIQSLAIQPIIEHRCVIAQAQSGTGKTGAFTIGILSILDYESPTTQALVLAPTRELAGQIFRFFIELSKHIPKCTVQLYIGGTSAKDDEMRHGSQSPKVVVASPGKAKHLIENGIINVQNLKVFCLDEADEMLNENFLEDLKQIFSFLSESMQFLLFSATFPPEIIQLAVSFLHDPVKIFVQKDILTLQGISQFFVNVVQSQYKLQTLSDLYSQIHVQKAVIFGNTRDSVNYLATELRKQNFTVLAIHSGLEQNERDEVMTKFRLGAARVLIATDLIGRGIDIQQITLVINFELPRTNEQYLHRIGRSGRYGRKGVAINIVDEFEMRKVSSIEKEFSTKIDPLPENISNLMEQIQEEQPPDQAE